MLKDNAVNWFSKMESCSRKGILHTEGLPENSLLPVLERQKGRERDMETEGETVRRRISSNEAVYGLSLVIGDVHVSSASREPSFAPTRLNFLLALLVC